MGFSIYVDCGAVMRRIAVHAAADAVLLTVENMHEVADWIDGCIVGTKLDPEDRAVKFHNYDNEEHEVGVGQWIVRYSLANGSRYGMVLSPEVFLPMFDQGQRSI